MPWNVFEALRTAHSGFDQITLEKEMIVDNKTTTLMQLVQVFNFDEISQLTIAGERIIAEFVAVQRDERLLVRLDESVMEPVELDLTDDQFEAMSAPADLLSEVDDLLS